MNLITLILLSLLTFTALAASSVNGGTRPPQIATRDTTNRLIVATVSGTFAPRDEMSTEFSRTKEMGNKRNL